MTNTKKMSDAESLTAEDLRSRLYNSLQEKGLVDALKSQLRNKLVSELRRVGVEQPFRSEPQHSPEGSLLHKASNSLVADHLRRCHYDYSLSVFLPECGLSQGQLFTTRDLLQLLNVSPHSRLYQNLASQSEQAHRKGFLWQMLCEVSSICGHSCKDTGVQTDATRLPHPTSLEEQFRKLDSYYSTIGDEHKQKWLAVEERILSYQKQLEDRSRHDLQLQVARFKENELSRMRIEERERGRQEIDRIRKEMELTYKTKSDSLLQRERHLEERLKKDQESSEKETYQQRQSLLAEIDAVRQREATTRRKDEIDLREKLLWEERMKTKEQLLKNREEDVRKANLEYNQKLNDEIKKFKLQEEGRLLDRTKDLDHREMRVRENERRLDTELRSIHDVQEELRQKRKLCLELEGELSVAKHDLVNVRTEAGLLGNKMREMVDYQMVKEDNAVQKREAENLKMRTAELSRDLMFERQKNEELLREMTDRASKPTPEVYLMQKEVEKVRNEMKQERAVFEHHKNNVEKRYQDEVDRNHDLLHKYEEQTLQLEEMNREIRDLRQQLGEHHTALTNEVYRKAKPSVLNRSDSLCDLEASGVDPTLIRNCTQPELLFSASHGLIDNILEQHGLHSPVRGSTSRSEDYSYSSDIVTDTKRRLRSLEREAETLEHHYQNFQYRMTAVHALDEPVQPPPSLIRSRTQHVDTTPQRPTRGKTGATDGRPMSSTPARQKLIDATRAHSPSSHELVGSSSLLDNSMSTVQSTSPLHRDDKTVGYRPLNMNDLDLRPGSPELVIVPGSDQESHSSTQTVIEDKEQKEKEALRRQQEEDRVYEEERRKRQEERERREQEAWEREQRVLREMEQGESGDKATGHEKPINKDPDQDHDTKEPQIDPTMLKYMEMVQQQKQHEKEVVKKTVDVWSKNKKEKTPSQSEDLSLCADQSDDGGSDDGDFW